MENSENRPELPQNVLAPKLPNGLAVTDQANDGEAATTTDNNTTEVKPSGASLYCPNNRRSHAGLLDFDILECPHCGADLKAPKISEIKPAGQNGESKDKDQDKGENQDGDDDEEDEEEGNDSNDRIFGYRNKKAKSLYAQNLLEFRDCDGDLIARQKWQKESFNLSSARPAETDEYLVLQAIVRLHTNIDLRDIEQSHKKDLLAHRRYQFFYMGTALCIYSDVIIAALKSVATYANSLAIGGPYTVEEPYSIIGHHLPALKDYASKIDAKKSIDKGSESGENHVDPGLDESKHFNILFNWLKTIQYEEKLAAEAERNARGVCTFQMLWSILKPNTTVYMTSQGILGAYVVDSVTIATLVYSRAENRVGLLSAKVLDKLGYTVKLWNLQYDGRFVGRKMTSVTIPFFAGEKEISSLIIIPTDFYKEDKPGAMRVKMEKWGESWYKSLRGKQVFYKGRSVEKPEKQIEGRAYIDPFGQGAAISRGMLKYDPMEDEGWFEHQREIRRIGDEVRCSCEQCHGIREHPAPDFPWKDYDVIDPKTVYDLELPDSPWGPRHRYFVSDRRVWAVMLKTRNWELLDIAHCSEPSFNDNSLEKLVMPIERKNLIKALVMKFKDTDSRGKGNSSWRADFVEGKGEGTIFLLHGSPGVGKTFTAECIAEYTGRPLISLTCADVGTDEVAIEGRLELWLNRAERWGAVLLIDEADIFLERRQITDLKRNSLVSVFLRCLEYYRGILFLTTNRVGHFDDAFISRIHVVIKYEALGEAERKQIWGQFFDKLEAERQDFIVTRNARNYVLGDEPEALHKQPWNGREIRNVFQTAVALAEYRAQTERGKGEPTLKLIDFDQVCDMTKHFKKYLEGISGLNEEQRAYNLGARVNTQEF